MSKAKRLLIIFVVLGLVGLFLWPTIRWYALIPQDQKTLAMGTREDIREYSRKMATKDLAGIKDKANANPDEALPKEYKFLAKQARKEYKLNEIDVPKTWTYSNVLDAFENEGATIKALESRYRDRILKIKDLHSDAIQLGLDLSGGMSIIIQASVPKTEVAEATDGTAPKADKNAKSKSASGTSGDLMDRAMEVLTSRIDQFGLTEPVIRRQGTDQIYVEIPGAADPERIKSIIMGKGRLAFHIVDMNATSAASQYLTDNVDGLLPDGSLTDPNVIPAGYVVRKIYQRDKYGIDEFTGNYLVVTKEPGMDGNYVSDAQSTMDPDTGEPAVSFKLKKEGADVFFQLTSANKDKYLAILLDDKVKSYAKINSAIHDSGQITGLDQEEATNISKMLRTAALPIELEPVSQQAIGASLGQDAIRQGEYALFGGILAVLVFMLLYYKGAGLNAMVAQILNMVIMLGVLSAFNLTLTLPSIAGFVLTIGMAIDANVIVFERIKDELRLGKGRKASIQAGFDKAFWAIIDSNITTIIAAVFLAMLGSGPIKGFAISLAIGNVSSLFTALFVSHLMFDFGTDVAKSKFVSISWRVR